ncbi:RNA-binding transcriptional accessory protein [Moraxella sp. FZLJ2107]|uniref:helix-hairpin-helix domain-containing protein n=1 Tax=unclassified Moraxella TaxID=2685852 RepID=UPI0020C8903A|nr:MULTISPECIES: Tex family protein [unclassified Moraxella]UTO04318.1 RNA-binding transcriptional accessory protein [Moraxella sp. FZLJ2107]UTO23151.1 RNA-binding transcriptional accessory protein [Moraxella sp. FZLJ2109]
MTDLLPQEIDHQAIYAKLAQAHAVRASQVEGFAKLFDEGNSVPFIARYRKDQTGGLDDDLLRQLEKSLIAERELAARRIKILELLAAQNVLNAELSERVNAAGSKLELEEIYQPYRPRRRSNATKAKLAGLEPIARAVLDGADPVDALAGFVAPSTLTDETGETFDADFGDLDKQIAGVQAIILDDWATALDLYDAVRTGFNATASIRSELIDEGKREVGEKFKDYFEHTEPFARLSNHRLLAMLRGRQQNVLVLHVDGEDEPFIAMIVKHFAVDSAKANGEILTDAAKKLWTAKWRAQIEHRLLIERRVRAETDAIAVFAENLKHLLMVAPAGRKVILGVDPGIRHGVKMAVIDSTGDVLATQTVYPFKPQNQVEQARAVIEELITAHGVQLVAIGNGTASRETEELVKSVIAERKLNATALVVSEAGASVYSASEIASSELPDLDVSVRGAVSIARRLQDPLSELVKVEPKAIGVGQYQHDVNQAELEASLDKVTEDCVNAVGVDVNTASPAILAHISGLNKNVAQQIVDYRRANGAFVNREQLKNVPRLGVKTFEQAAGFLRIKDGDEPLDATGVHPESYGLVYEILAKHGKSLDEVLGNETTAKALNDSTDNFSQLATVTAELAKPAHDPRGEFRTAKFRDDVNEIKDLEVGMVLEGVVTNVTAFGCFVDVGVHQDGLVHISELSDDFVENPADVVKPQDIVTVRVISVDEARGRIGFSMKSEKSAKVDKSDKADKSERAAKAKSERRPARQDKADKAKPAAMGSFGALLKQAGLGK